MRRMLALAALAASVAALWDGGAGPAPAPIIKTPAPPPAAPGGGSARVAASPQGSGTVAAQPASIHWVEAQVRQARLDGRGDNEVHRLRTAHLPAAQVAALAAMESAESDWQRRLRALQAACAQTAADCAGERLRRFNADELPRLSSYEAPSLRQ